MPISDIKTLIVYQLFLEPEWTLSQYIAHEAEGHEGETNNCFSKIQLVSKKYRDKTT